MGKKKQISRGAKMHRGAACFTFKVEFKGKMGLFSWWRLGCGVLAAGLVGISADAATWFPLGPFGGDARALAADPADSRHVFLGTLTGWIYDSHDGGSTWTRVAQIAHRNDLVVKHIVVDSRNPKRLVVAAYTVDRPDGGLFISEDYGKNWYSQAEMRGQSIRSLARSLSDSNELVAGTLKGIFRSVDNGVHWKQISPVGNDEIHEVESIAIDPADPNVIYAGTWHLPWKTTDGGATWHNIKQGIIDDSDVFSIIVDPKDPRTVYASACSGIYKSSDAGDMFHKVQGIPSAARRTRTLEQDPSNLNTVFAGTTEGLYRTLDAGAHWDRLTPADVIVNDVYVDPAHADHVLIATDRGGVFRSDDAGVSFEASNQGFSARQVTAYAADAQSAGIVYVGVVNDKTTGGVFQSADGGVKWRQQSEGLGGRDVFSLVSLDDGTLLAGTGHGIFRLQGDTWADSSALQGPPVVSRPENESKTNVVLPAPTHLNTPATERHSGAAPAKTHKAAVKHTSARAVRHGGAAPGLRTAKRVSGVRASKRHGTRLMLAKGHVQGAKTGVQHPAVAAKRPAHAVTGAPAVPKPALAKAAAMDRLDSEVYALGRAKDALFAGTSSGLLRSEDQGQHWSPVTSLAMPDVHYFSTTPTAPNSRGAGPMLLVGSLQRLSLSPDGGATWDTVALPADLTQIGALAVDGEKNLWVGGREGVWLSTDYGATWTTLKNLFLTEVDSLYFDPTAKRLLVTASNSPVAFSVSMGDHKVSYWDTGWKLRFVRPVGDHLIGATLFDGVIVQPRMVESPEVAGAAAK